MYFAIEIVVFSSVVVKHLMALVLIVPITNNEIYSDNIERKKYMENKL